jgi:hypothetical protein
MKIEGNAKSFSTLIHDRNQLPSFGFTETMKYTHFEYTMNKFRRLPSPYSTDCFDYKSSIVSKIRGQCVNNCHIDNLLRKNNCLPKDFEKLTFASIDSINSSFCENSNIKKIVGSKCSKICKLSCEESNFLTTQIIEKAIRPSNQKYITYVNDPLITFAAFLSTIGGLLGLWNNLSINDLNIIFLNLAKKFFETRFLIILKAYITSMLFTFHFLKTELFLKSISAKVNLKALHFHLNFNLKLNTDKVLENILLI